MSEWLPVETVTPPADEPFLIGQLRAHCRIDTNDEDATLLGLGIAARRHIEAYAGIRLFTQTVRLRRRCFADRMTLPIAPIQSVSAIEYLDSAGATQTLDPATYELLPYGLRPEIHRIAGKSWPGLSVSAAAVTITAVAGYGGLNDQPEDIRLALQMLVANWFDSRAAVGDGQFAELPFGVARLLANHRVYSF